MARQIFNRFNGSIRIHPETGQRFRSKERRARIPMVVAQEKYELQQPILTSPRPRKRPAPRPKQKGKAKGILVLLLAAGIVGSIGVATVHVTVVQGANVRTLQKEIEEIKIQNDLLQVDVDKLRSVSRIESEALAMGMEKPSGTVYVAGALSPVEQETGTTQPQVAEQQTEAKPSALQQLSQLFTNFFALLQR